ncbi:MAG: hypothetical protein EAZ62_07555 [Sphingobacteriia bacterium]|nr:MAG: hypothetical protein EAZ62_07555 [Sphingobacteriia bacterium]
MPWLLKPLNGNKMRVIKLGALSVVFLFLLVMGIGLLFPSNVVVSRAITLQAPPDSVKSLVFSFAKWETWINQVQPGYALYKEDSLFLGTTKVIRLSLNDSVQVNQWNMMDGTKMISTVRVLPVRDAKGQASSTIMQWQFEEKIGWWPWERMASMMNDKMLGTLMEENLAKLQKRVEKK